MNNQSNIANMSDLEQEMMASTFKTIKANRAAQFSATPRAFEKQAKFERAAARARKLRQRWADEENGLAR